MWAKLDDRFPGHPKVRKAGPEAAWLYVCGLCYCSSYLTDGEIPKDQVPLLTALSEPMKLAEKLVQVRLWEKRDESFWVHDYLVYNPSKAQEDKRRAKDRDRKQKKKDSAGNPLGVLQSESARNPNDARTGRDWTGRDGTGTDERDYELYEFNGQKFKVCDDADEVFSVAQGVYLIGAEREEVLDSFRADKIPARRGAG